MNQAEFNTVKETMETNLAEMVKGMSFVYNLPVLSQMQLDSNVIPGVSYGTKAIAVANWEITFKTYQSGANKVFESFAEKYGLEYTSLDIPPSQENSSEQ